MAVLVVNTVIDLADLKGFKRAVCSRAIPIKGRRGTTDDAAHERFRITAVRRLARRVFDLTQKPLFVA
jgi:hypothetical protein